MKKLISFCVLLLLAVAVKAQSAEETLEWLRAKQPSIRGNSVTIGDTSIKYKEGDKAVEIQWNQVKDVTGKMIEIIIVGQQIVDGKNVFIRLNIDYKISEKYAKALKHLAEIKGAKMVKDDLF